MRWISRRIRDRHRVRPEAAFEAGVRHDRGAAVSGPKMQTMSSSTYARELEATAAGRAPACRTMPTPSSSEAHRMLALDRTARLVPPWLASGAVARASAAEPQPADAAKAGAQAR